MLNIRRAEEKDLGSVLDLLSQVLEVHAVIRPDGWVHVSLNMDNSFFFVKVEDSGIGIPEASQQFIFERFYRVDKSHSREIGGTGLGLAITRSAVLMHHGAIRVYSKEGEGTTFTIKIPLKRG